jgi:hypothetical protein
MVGSLGIKWVAIGAVVLLAAAACGDDGSGANPERFCELAAGLDQNSDDPWELPPDEAREALLEFQDLMDEAVSVAPDEVRASVEYIAETNALVRDFFEAHDFDIADVDEAELDALEAEADALSAELEARSADDLGAGPEEWIAANCSA